MATERFMGLCCLLAMGLVSPRSADAATVLLDEGFEGPDALAAWQQTATFTAAGAEIAAPGQLSEHCLRLPKPDMCGMAFKDHGNWQSVYLGAIGLVPPELLRTLGRFKGLHVYCESGDPMYFCRSLVGIHAGAEASGRR